MRVKRRDTDSLECGGDFRMKIRRDRNLEGRLLVFPGARDEALILAGQQVLERPRPGGSII